MSQELAVTPLAVDTLERVLVSGDLSKLTTPERLHYYRHVCESLGINPLTRPFEYIQLSGKLTLYAKRDCTDQLRTTRGISVTIVSRERHDDLSIVTARATDKQGRTDESIGAVTLAGLKGEALANALMKSETKAKRRVTLSIVGLGWLDETEIETIAEARVPQRLPDEAAVPPALHETITDGQLKMVIIAQKDCGVRDEEFKVYLQERHKIASRKQIRQQDLNAALDWLHRQHNDRIDREEQEQESDRIAILGESGLPIGMEN